MPGAMKETDEIGRRKLATMRSSSGGSSPTSAATRGWASAPSLCLVIVDVASVLQPYLVKHAIDVRRRAERTSPG